MKGVLHIGIEKTGTSSLQEFFYKNRDALIASGVGYTQSCGRRNNRLLATMAMDPGQFDDDQLIDLRIKTAEAKAALEAKTKAALKLEISSLAPSCGTTIFSAEHLQSRLQTPAELTHLRELLLSVGVTVTKVIVYFRDPVQIAASIYSTGLRSGDRDDVPPEPDILRHICDHRNTVRLWETAFPHAELIVRLYDPKFLLNGDIIDDFCSLIGIDVAQFQKPPRQNVSINRTGQQLLRILNDRIPRFTESGGNPLRGDMVDIIDAHYAGRTPPLSSSLHAAYRSAFRDSNEYLRQRFFPHIPSLFDEDPAPDADESHAGLTKEQILDFMTVAWTTHVSEILWLRKDNKTFRQANKEMKGELVFLWKLKRPFRITRRWVLRAWRNLYFRHDISPLFRRSRQGFRRYRR
jgi:hypothetical protein